MLSKSATSLPFGSAVHFQLVNGALLQVEMRFHKLNDAISNRPGGQESIQRKNPVGT